MYRKPYIPFFIFFRYNIKHIKHKFNIMIKKILLTLIIFNFFFPFNAKAEDAPKINVGKRDSEPIILTNPLAGIAETPEELIGQVINGILGIIGSLALAMFIYGGLTWMLAAGESGKVQKGKDILMWAVIGLVIIFSAYAMVSFVIKGIAGGGA